MSECPGLLDLFHPRGATGRGTVIGAACPARLRSLHPDAATPWDLAVLAPSPMEARSRDWRLATVHLLQSSVAAHGLVYLIAPPPARWRIARALAGAGFARVDAVLHLPDIASSELLLPINRRALRGAVDRLLVPGSPKRRLITGALAVPGPASLLARLHPSVGLVLRRPHAPPLAEWLAGGSAGSIAALQTRWRADRARSVIHVLPGAGARAGVVKVMLRARDAAGDMQREAAALSDLASAARAAGAAVPEGTMIDRSPCCPALHLERLPGVTVGRLLGQQPARHEAIVRQLGRWLEAWSRTTLRTERADRALLDRWLIGPARRLADDFEDGAGYAAWLESIAQRVIGRSVPLIATHNDLTMSNVLIGPDGQLGVVDWEAATRDGLPLRDFCYAAVDATAARDGYRDRPAAFDRCFGREGMPFVGEIMSALRAAIELPDDFATIAFHACWLQHAEDERRKREPGEPLPFLGVARRAAALRWQA